MPTIKYEDKLTTIMIRTITIVDGKLFKLNIKI